MKRNLVIGLALSVLSATSAFASTQTVTSAAQPVVAEASNVRTIDRLHVTDTGSTSMNGVQDSLKGLVVAENRKEFGSQYQRY
ncbi:hypothetical protein [Pseudomonas sp. NA-150]|uniref:hypothetical protein n=1 Tax=Pseudomonas sp. NA-150 TaxID=3367525 RepID=UPI0037C54C53